MATFHLEIISKEKVILKDEVDKLIVPSVKGSLCVLAHHEPYFVQLKKGTIRVEKKGKEEVFEIKKGYLKISSEKTTVVVEIIRNNQKTKKKKKSRKTQQLKAEVPLAVAASRKRKKRKLYYEQGIMIF